MASSQIRNSHSLAIRNRATGPGRQWFLFEHNKPPATIKSSPFKAFYERGAVP